MSQMRTFPLSLHSSARGCEGASGDEQQWGREVGIGEGRGNAAGRLCVDLCVCVCVCALICVCVCVCVR